LERQKTSFETRILKRIHEPEFIAPANVNNEISSPLLLYGDWYEGDLANGLRWLSSIAYKLPYPCIILPPFETGSLESILGLKVGLEVISLNTNKVNLESEELFLERLALRIQSDYGFRGPAGRSIVATQTKESVVTVIQPKSNDTPLVLCGLRILSTSGLSDENDRQEFFSALIDWAKGHTKEPQAARDFPSEPDRDFSPEILKSVMLMLAVGKADTQASLTSLANTVLGISICKVDMDASLNKLIELDVIKVKKGVIQTHAEKLDQYLQDAGLWSYVRILREDHK